jgi:hypothetical protein
MASPESIDLLLRLAAQLLDRAAGEIRDARLPPVRANITQIGKALAEIYEINAVIYESHPNLRPAYLDEPDPHPESNRRLTAAMVNASEHEDAGNLAEAIATFRAVMEVEKTPLHLEIAQGEIERLQRKRND